MPPPTVKAILLTMVVSAYTYNSNIAIQQYSNTAIQQYSNTAWRRRKKENVSDSGREYSAAQ